MMRTSALLLFALLAACAYQPAPAPVPGPSLLDISAALGRARAEGTSLGAQMDRYSGDGKLRSLTGPDITCRSYRSLGQTYTDCNYR